MEFHPRSVISTVLDSVTYICVLLPCIPCYSSPCISFHTRSFSHPGVARLRPSISTCRTRSTAHMGVSRIHPIILTTRYAYQPSPGSYRVALPYPCLQILVSREISSRVIQRCLYVTPCIHHASHLLPPPSYPVLPVRHALYGSRYTQSI